MILHHGIVIISFTIVSTMVGAAAESASRKKVAKYANLSRTHDFIPIAIESLEPCNADGFAFLKEVLAVA